MKRTVLPAILIVLVIVAASFSGCSGGNSSSSSTAAARAELGRPIAAASPPSPEEYEIAVEDAAPQDANNMVTGGSAGGLDMGGGSAASSAIRPQDDTRKIIYTADVMLQTRSFDDGLSVIERMVADIGGYVQSTNVSGHNLYAPENRSGRWANFSVRVPVEKLQEFLDGLSADFNVGSTGIYSQDITLDYFDVESRLKAYTIQRDKLLEMLEQATEVRALIEIQTELGKVNYEIEALTSSLNRLNDQVTLSTVNLNVEEVVEYDDFQPVTAPFGEQITSAFQAGWRGFASFCRNSVLFLVRSTPFFAIAIPVAAVVAGLLLRRRKNRSQKPLQEQKHASRPPEAGE
jgi:D-Tyr-tRNAtyr deacylase